MLKEIDLNEILWSKCAFASLRPVLVNQYPCWETEGKSSRPVLFLTDREFRPPHAGTMRSFAPPLLLPVSAATLLCVAVLLLGAAPRPAAAAGRRPKKKGYSSSVHLTEEDPPLWRAAEDGNLKLCKVAVDVHHDDPNTVRDNRGHTALHWACTNNHLHVVKYLLALPDIDVNAIDKDHITPLHIASHRGYYKIVRLLLEHGADQHLQSHHFHLESHAHHFASKDAHRSKRHAHTVKTLVGHAFGVMHLVPEHHDSDEL